MRPGTLAPQAAGAEITQVLSSLLKNAFEASEPSAIVTVRALQRNGMVRIEVHDTGAGMSPEAMWRAGEPFYTTKAPGRGLGLGLFLARTFAERAGGTLTIETDAGTTVVMELPTATAGVVPA
jgi:two-component system, sensor histidine kinase RegB